jgi:EAL domain-containing protein (putative c-di-GMP-specific phosphodiesterase class I)/FixJ family two-component response regulator
MNVLVVEDDAIQRRMASAAVRALSGADIIEAEDGREALERLDAYDGLLPLALCDVNMSGMDGIELLRRLGERRMVGAVIVMSAMDPTLLGSVERMARESGLNVLGVLDKPVTREKLAPLFARLAQRPVEAVRTRDPFVYRDVRAAIDAGEIEPFFQPKFAIRGRRMVGAEALARWRHPRHGLVPPGEFIGVAERTGLIADLTWAVIDRSVAAVRTWHESGHRALTVAINLSNAFLVDPGVTDRITLCCAEHGVASESVVFEITESMAAENVVPLLANLARLRMRGFGLAIDDFGTGYASMDQLGRIPFTELKIDRGFVTDVANKPGARAILESSLDLARRFGLKSVAEGVESEADLQVLESLGCEYAQGYALARPMDGAALLAFAAAQPAT